MEMSIVDRPGPSAAPSVPAATAGPMDRARARGRALALALACLSLSLAVLLAAAPASAQYFGRNKVQYEDFDWSVLHTDAFDVHFYEEERQASVDGARMVERWNTRLSQAFQHTLRETKPVVFYADHPDFQQTNVISGTIGEGTGGVTEALKNRMTQPFTGIYEDNDHVIGHELVHVYQYDIAAGVGGGGLSGISAMGRLPLWLTEGMAEYLSTGREDAHTAMWMRDAVLREDLPTIRDLTRDPRYFPYRYGQALLAYVAGLYGDGAVTALFRTGLRAGWEGSVRSVLGMTSDSLSRQWIAATRATYLPTMEGRTLPADVGQLVLAEEIDGGDTNLSPAISPDGRWVAFITEKDLFSYDYYVADAHTGEVRMKLASAESDLHFDALSFLNSAGTWSPDSRRFAFVVFAEGDNQLAIVDVESGDVTQTVAVQGVGAIRDPSWSPDGRSIAFSGMAGGISDLYVLDIASGQVRQLTNDRYADIQPTWSPDGTRLAFTTDRGPGTDFARLVYGNMNLGLFDLGGGSIDLLPAIDDQSKHINPQFAPDGQSLFLIADRNGFSDVYRLDLATMQYHQVTNVATGVSGITELSPALTVALRDGRMMFSVFGDGQFTVHALTPDQTAGTPVTDVTEGIVVARVLPPVEAYGDGLISRYLDDALTGLPSATAFEITDYDPDLSLDYVGTPALGVGYDPVFGTGIGGAVSFLFSDMLGNQQVGVAVQAQGSFKDIGGQAVYINAEDRWNWGGVVQHVPYLSGFRQQVLTGPASYVDYVLRERFYVSQLEGMLQYPFSMTRRFEASGGYTRYAYDVEIDSIVVENGQIVSRGSQGLEELEAPDMHLFSAASAFVGDNSFFAFTGPVRGGRYRYEISPTVGTLNFLNLLADHRRYFFFNPLTVAFRGMHYGYYLGDESDSRLRDGLFLGYENLVRGYASESFEAAECSAGAGQQCAEYRRLFGSRIAVFNAEVRVPVLGVEEFGLIPFPYLPMELAAFFDAGFAWCGDSEPMFAARSTAVSCGPVPLAGGGFEEEETRFAFETDATPDRIPVFSTGISARFNILGYVVLEAYYAYPFQRPEKGAHFGFNLAPGW